MQGILTAIIASLIYMFLFWLPKKVDTVDPEEIDPIKIIRTLVWGILLGLFLAYYGVELTVGQMEYWIGELMGYGVLVGIVDKTTLLIYRLLKKYGILDLDF